MTPGEGPSGAGASAQREYERRRIVRRDRARERYGVFGLAVAHLAEPDSTRAWKQGAQGEIRSARDLEHALRGRGVVLLHDRRIPGRGAANIDHLTVGPGGVTVIDTKSARGLIEVRSVGGFLSPRRELLLVNGRDRTRQLDGVERQVADVSAALVKLGEGGVWLRGALCYPYIDGLPRFGRLEAREGRVIIDDPRGVAKLARRRGTLDAQQVALLAEGLARRLPAA